MLFVISANEDQPPSRVDWCNFDDFDTSFTTPKPAVRTYRAAKTEVTQ